jgi:iron(III)-enterobactin esterase
LPGGATRAEYRDIVSVREKDCGARFWLSVGTQEIETGVHHPPTRLFQRVSQIEGVERAARFFESLGGTVHHNLYSGGHAFSPWREELATALRWLCLTVPTA